MFEVKCRLSLNTNVFVEIDCPTFSGTLGGSWTDITTTTQQLDQKVHHPVEKWNLFQHKVQEINKEWLKQMNSTKKK